jgi:death-on-curing protein
VTGDREHEKDRRFALSNLALEAARLALGQQAAMERRDETQHVIMAAAMCLVQCGGLAGLRDEGLLESALARPEQLANYASPDVADIAAAYAFGLAKNHPFVDGNKRTAFLALGLSLRLNGYRLTASQPDATQTILLLAAGELSEQALATWIRSQMAR